MTEPANPQPDRRAAKKTEVADRRRKVSALHLARVPQKEIAQRLKVSESLVSRDLDHIREAWRQDYIQDAARLKMRECAALDGDEARVRARLASVPDMPTLPNHADPDARAMHAETWDKVSRTYCRLQETAIKIMDRRAKLLGLDAPQVVENKGAQSLRVEFVNDWTPNLPVTVVEAQAPQNGHAAPPEAAPTP